MTFMLTYDTYSYTNPSLQFQLHLPYACHSYIRLRYVFEYQFEFYYDIISFNFSYLNWEYHHATFTPCNMALNEREIFNRNYFAIFLWHCVV